MNAATYFETAIAPFAPSAYRTALVESAPAITASGCSFWRDDTSERCKVRSSGPGGRAMEYRNDPAGERLPVKLDTTSNGEFAPIPLEAIHRRANALALEEAGRHARRLGLDRRSFLVSSCG